MTTAFDIAADLDTPVSAYIKLRGFRPCFLLESVEGGERLGRYSFIGFGDAYTVRLAGDDLHVNGTQRPAPSTGADLLGALRGALDGAPRLEPVLPSAPFAGGLVGWTGYALARRFEGPDAPRSDPSLPDAAYVAPASVLVFDHLTRRAALAHAGSEGERAALRRAVVDALRGPLPSRDTGGRASPPTPSLDRDAFLRAVERAKQEITLGEVYQLVLSVQFAGRCDIPSFEVYRALRVLNPSPYMYYVDIDDTAVIGSSPEALVRLADGVATLRPIAGTRPRGTDDAHDHALEKELLADPKEAAEHVMLVDLARNDVGRVAAPGSVRVDPYRSVERYSHVMHLVSGVRAALAPPADAFDLFAAAFPAGTVVGAPKIRAMQLIDEIEPVPRGVYAGTVGYFGHAGTMDHAIAIRTIVMRGDAYTYQAGAGIVADSIPAAEHAEIGAKSAALQAALALAEEGL